MHRILFTVVIAIAFVFAVTLGSFVVLGLFDPSETWFLILASFTPAISVGLLARFWLSHGVRRMMPLAVGVIYVLIVVPNYLNFARPTVTTFPGEGVPPASSVSWPLVIAIGITAVIVNLGLIHGRRRDPNRLERNLTTGCPQ